MRSDRLAALRLGVKTATSAAVALHVLTSPLAAAGAPQSVRGVVRAEASATISGELVARIARLPFKPGQSFRAGDLLIAFECGRFEADLRAVEADVATRAIEVAANRELLRHKAAGANELALAEARQAQAVATAESLRLRTGQCIVTAPYDGRVVDRLVEEFEVPQSGAPLIKIVKSGRLEIELIVPSNWAVWLKPGDEFSFRVDETGSTHKARLRDLGAIVERGDDDRGQDQPQPDRAVQGHGCLPARASQR